MAGTRRKIKASDMATVAQALAYAIEAIHMLPGAPYSAAAGQRSRRHFRNPRREGSTDAAPRSYHIFCGLLALLAHQPKTQKTSDPIIVTLDEYRRCRKLALRLDRKLDAADWLEPPSTPQRHEADRAAEAESAAALRLAETKPRTPAGAAAVLDYLIEEIFDKPDHWHTVAISNIAAALRAM
jgi:hypothetical protein